MLTTETRHQAKPSAQTVRRNPDSDLTHPSADETTRSTQRPVLLGNGATAQFRLPRQ